MHARAVRSSLEARGVEAEILDFADFPQDRAIVHRSGGDGGEISLGGDVDARRQWALWFRRPQPHRLAPGLSEDYADYTKRATRTALIAALASGAQYFINRPEPFGLVYDKPFQIELARWAGLPVPETLVTNDPDLARDFVARHSGAMIKSPVSWRFRMLETRMIRPDLGFDFGLVGVCVLLQAPLVGTREFRVTMVAEKVFSAATQLKGGSLQEGLRIGERGDCEPAELPKRSSTTGANFMRLSCSNMAPTTCAATRTASRTFSRSTRTANICLSRSKLGCRSAMPGLSAWRRRSD